VLVSREIAVLRKCRLESSGRRLDLSRGTQPSEPPALRLRVANSAAVSTLSPSYSAAMASAISFGDANCLPFVALGFNSQLSREK
jgi:hypothetical protein